MSAPFDIAVAVILVLLAFGTTLARGTFAAIGSFVAMGLILVVVWLRLAAPDVALTEGAVGGGLTGLLFFAAYAKLRLHPPCDTAPQPTAVVRVLVAILCLGIAGVVFAVVVSLPDSAPSQAVEVARNLPALGVENPVVGVLMGFRALDTLLEVAAVFLALMGVWSLAGDRAWGGAPEVSPRPRSETLDFLARVLPPFGLVLGVFVVWKGSSSPGGEFPGSAILAAMWLLLLLAGLARPPLTSGLRLRLAVVAGPLVFFGVGLAGIGLTGSFLGYPPGIAKALIVAIELPLTLSLATMLVLVVAGPPHRPSRPTTIDPGTS